MFPSTLYGKMVMLLVTLFFLLAVLFAVVAQISSERYHHEASQKLHNNLAETIVSQNKLITNGQLDLLVAHNVFDLAMSINPSIEIYLLDIQGSILSYSAPNGKVKRNSIDLTAL